MSKTAAMNTPEAKEKRAETLAKKLAAKESDDKLMAIAKQIPDEWADGEEQKLSLIKSIYLDVLGTHIVKGRDDRGKEIETVEHRPLADLRYFMFLSAQRKLNPFKNQIHAVYIWDSTIKGEKLVPITGIDGFASLAQRTGRYAGVSDATFEFYPDNHDKYAELPKSATVDLFAYNPVTGAREAVVRATVWWEEYAKYKEIWKYDSGQKKKVGTGEFVLNSTWRNRPKGQLEKCAQALAFRRGFPEETGGLYVIQEVDRLRDKPDVIDVDPQSDQPSTKETIQAALDKRKAEGKSVANGDTPEPETPLHEPVNSSTDEPHVSPTDPNEPPEPSVENG